MTTAARLEDSRPLQRATGAAPPPTCAGQQPSAGSAQASTGCPAKPPAGSTLARTVLVERRDLGADRPRLKPKPDAAAQLREVAAAMRDMPRDCAVDRAELLLWLSRMARQLDAVALDGFEAVPAVPRTSNARQPFLGRPSADARAIAEALFGAAGRPRSLRGDDAFVGQIIGRKGQRVRIEVRRARAGGQMELGV